MQISEATPTSPVVRPTRGLPPVQPAPGRMRAAVRPAAALVALALLVLSASACGDDDDPEGATGTSALGGTVTSAPSDTSVPDPDVTADTVPDPASEEEQVLAAVQCYWDTLIAANSPPDPDHPGFDRCFTGRALETAIAVTTNRANLGQAVRDADGIVPQTVEVLTVDDREAKVRNCLVDDGVLIDGDTGRVLNDGISTQITELSLLLGADGHWRVEYALLAEKWEGRQECP